LEVELSTEADLPFHTKEPIGRHAATTGNIQTEQMMTARLMILNGPNLNLLGVREPHIYGSTTLAAIKASCEAFAKSTGAQLSFHQSNHEGALVDLIQAAREEADAIIINPAGYSFTSVAMFDALKIFEGPIIELHISNIHARDELHRHSKLSSAVKAVICGLGPYGYIVALQAALHMLGQLPASLPAAIRVGPQ
jgi:3-dehydroquinate dehydratase-2